MTHEQNIFFKYSFVQRHKELSLDTQQSKANTLQEEILPIEKKVGISSTDGGERKNCRIYFLKVY